MGSGLGKLSAAIKSCTSSCMSSPDKPMPKQVQAIKTAAAGGEKVSWGMS